MIMDYHKIEEYINLFKEKGLLVSADEIDSRDVRYISYDSQDVSYGTLFVCKGAHFKDEYLQDALEKGAFCYVAEKRFESGKGIIVNDIRKAMAFMASFYYNNVWDKLYLTGITGTKGKSSTAYMVKYILDDYLKENREKESAIVSGIDNFDGVIFEESHLTTPESFQLYKHFNNAYESGIKYLSMEVSSQALKYDRTLGVQYDIGAFLNIGEDHISGIEHPDFEDYFSSKLRLFSQCDCAVVNLNTDFEERVLEEAGKAPRVVTFGVGREDADIYGFDVEAGEKGTSFKVRCDAFEEEFSLGIRGLFNADNALAAIAICYALNIPLKNMKSGLKKARVAGRMEVFSDDERNIDVIVDYAHNKMSFETLFQSVKKEYPDRKVFIVFGCPGKKALGRRNELGTIAGKYADHVYITEEDAGEEPVLKICQEISDAVDAQGAEWDIITDRRDAIRESIEDAGKDTVILLTGKGRETRQKRGIQYIETPSDVDYVKEFLFKQDE